MSFARVLAVPTLASLLAVAVAGPALADDSGNFVLRLGNDTTSVEHYTRSASRIEVDQVGRAPRVLRRHYIYDFRNGMISAVSMVVTPPGSATPTQTIDASFTADSMRMQIKTPDAPARDLHIAMPAGTVVVAGSSPWAMYETQTMKLAGMKGDSLRATMYFLGAPSPQWLSLHKIGRDSMLVDNEHEDRYHVRVDKSGRVLGVLPISGTQKFAVERVASLDVGAYAASFAARETLGGGIGMLSPRDSVKVTTGGASLWIDYGRPSKRGRVVFGGIVPYGEVWRTGANAATQFKTDKSLDFGHGVMVPAGFYTLWTLPTASGWKLIVNSETGQWGTEHKAAKDLFTIDMTVSTMPVPVERFVITVEPSGQGGTLRFDWDTTRASAAFTVVP